MMDTENFQRVIPQTLEQVLTWAKQGIDPNTNTVDIISEIKYFILNSDKSELQIPHSFAKDILELVSMQLSKIKDPNCYVNSYIGSASALFQIMQKQKLNIDFPDNFIYDFLEILFKYPYQGKENNFEICSHLISSLSKIDGIKIPENILTIIINSNKKSADGLIGQISINELITLEKILDCVKDDSFVGVIDINALIALQKILDCLEAKNIKTNISRNNAEEILKLIKDHKSSQWDGASKLESNIKACYIIGFLERNMNFLKMNFPNDAETSKVDMSEWTFFKNRQSDLKKENEPHCKKEYLVTFYEELQEKTPSSEMKEFLEEEIQRCKNDQKEYLVTFYEELHEKTPSSEMKEFLAEEIKRCKNDQKEYLVTFYEELNENTPSSEMKEFLEEEIKRCKNDQCIENCTLSPEELQKYCLTYYDRSVQLFIARWSQNLEEGMINKIRSIDNDQGPITQEMAFLFKDKNTVNTKKKEIEFDGWVILEESQYNKF